jgi:hypothetical protein
MAYVSHYVTPYRLDAKVSSTLKRICNAWTKLDEWEYVVHHSDALKSSCPICTPSTK